MSYIQEKRLQKAMSNLYYLGRPDPKPKKEDNMQELASAVGQAAGKAVAKKPKPKAQPTPQATPEAAGGVTSRTWNPGPQQAQAMQYDPVKQAQQNVKNNDAANLAPHNGVYTQTGKENAIKQADDYASDIATGNQMMQHAVSLEEPTIPQGGGMQNPYTVGMGGSKRVRY